MDIISTIGSFWTAITKLKDRQMVPLQPNRVFTIDVFQKRTIFFCALCVDALAMPQIPHPLYDATDASHTGQSEKAFFFIRENQQHN